LAITLRSRLVRPSLVCYLRALVRILDTNPISVQLVSTIVVAFVQSGVKAWIFSNVPDICSPTQSSHLTCPHNKVFFSASAIWCVLFPWVAHGGRSYDPVFSRLGALLAPVDSLVTTRFTTHSCMRSSQAHCSHFHFGSCSGGDQTRGPSM
jgi:hypothetical protein